MVHLEYPGMVGPYIFAVFRALAKTCPPTATRWQGRSRCHCLGRGGSRMAQKLCEQCSMGAVMCSLVSGGRYWNPRESHEFGKSSRRDMGTARHVGCDSKVVKYVQLPGASHRKKNPGGRRSHTIYPLLIFRLARCITLSSKFRAKIKIKENTRNANGDDYISAPTLPLYMKHG